MQQQVTDMMASEEAKDVQISNLSEELVDMQNTVSLCQSENAETEARLGESNEQISQLKEEIERLNLVVQMNQPPGGTLEDIDRSKDSPKLASFGPIVVR